MREKILGANVLNRCSGKDLMSNSSRLYLLKEHGNLLFYIAHFGLLYCGEQSEIPWSQRFFLIFLRMREPQSGEHESRSGKKEKPLVTLDLNLTFMRTPTVKRVKLIIFIKGPIATQQARAYQPLIF